MKTTAILLMAAATAGAAGAWAMRPKCVTVETAATPARVAQVAAATVPIPSLIQEFPTPATSEPRRNVFAFAGFVRSRPPEKRAEAVPAVIVPATETTTVVVDPPAKKEPAYQYLGSFGPQSKPILVYKGNGDVVNVALGKP